ncbi:hypothetical protein EMIHUDRAFT_258961, partial [Emiliania huxleyi CCMP1516]
LICVTFADGEDGAAASATVRSVATRAHPSLPDALSAPSPAGRLLLGASRRLAAHRCVRAAPLHACERYVGHVDHVAGLAFSPDGRTLLSVGGGDAALLWDVAWREEAAVSDAIAQEGVDESLRQAAASRRRVLAAIEAEAAEARSVGAAPPSPGAAETLGSSADEDAAGDAARELEAAVVEAAVARLAERMARLEARGRGDGQPNAY